TAPAASRTGWIPANARQVRARSDLPADAQAAAPCVEAANPIALTKSVAVVGERQLRDATRLSDTEEAALGDRLERSAPAAAPFRGRWDRPDDVARWQGYLRDLVGHLAQHSERKGLRWRVHLVRDSSFNAAAMPGGVLMVHTGLLAGPQAVQSEAELATVLGHELAHVELRHPVAAYQYAKAVLGADADDAAVLARMMTLPISSEYEHEADRRGTDLAARGQYDPEAARRLWQRMATEGGGAGPGAGGGPAGALGGVLGELAGGLASVLATHPPPATRCARALVQAVRWRGDPTFDVFYVGESNLAARQIGPRHPL
ncbi:MAG: M48 family metallopeptidase, partial [Deltaproteobacteria bacterium]|nr:M48 family metallopeptidase [Deltaproteobacteria bacterium]